MCVWMFGWRYGCHGMIATPTSQLSYRAGYNGGYNEPLFIDLVFTRGSRSMMTENLISEHPRGTVIIDYFPHTSLMSTKNASL